MPIIWSINVYNSLTATRTIKILAKNYCVVSHKFCKKNSNPPYGWKVKMMFKLNELNRNTVKEILEFSQSKVSKAGVYSVILVIDTILVVTNQLVIFCSYGQLDWNP